jgi:hypothetical protein
MRDRPSSSDILRAVARLLESELKPLLTGQKALPSDPAALAFRVLIASHLVGQVAAEIDAEDDLDQREMRRLAALLPSLDLPAKAASGRRADRRAAALLANRELAERVRRGALSDDERKQLTDHVRATLTEELAVTNPKFGTSSDVD